MGRGGLEIIKIIWIFFSLFLTFTFPGVQWNGWGLRKINILTQRFVCISFLYSHSRCSHISDYLIRVFIFTIDSFSPWNSHPWNGIPRDFSHTIHQEVLSGGQYVINTFKKSNKIIQTTKNYKTITFLNSRYKNQFLNSQFLFTLTSEFTVQISCLFTSQPEAIFKS